MNLKDLSPKNTKRLNKIMESRFGVSIDYSKLSYRKAQALSNAITEQLQQIRKSHGLHTAEKNPKYMEMLMVREGVNAWIAHQNRLMEGELETAEVVLAAKDMVNSVQSMIEDASKMLNEQLPPLLDTIRDQVGTAQADAFKNTVTTSLNELMTSLNASRDSLDSASRSLAGEEAALPLDGAADLGAPVAPDMAAAGAEEVPATEPAAAPAGSPAELGRGRR